MSDLSQLLGDLYADETPVRKAPEWSSDEALDDAFASWVPGPAEGSAAAERSIVAAALDDTTCAPAPVAEDDWTSMTAPAPLAFVRWTASDDDILPTRHAKARLLFSLRRR